MDQKQEAELGLHLPWLVFLGTYRLLPWAMALCLHLPPAPAPWTTALLLKGLKRNVEKEAVRTAVAQRVSLRLSSYRSSRTLRSALSYILQCQWTKGGVVQERRVTRGPRCEQALIVGCPTYICNQPPDMRNCNCSNSVVPHFTAFYFTI